MKKLKNVLNILDGLIDGSFINCYKNNSNYQDLQAARVN